MSVNDEDLPQRPLAQPIHAGPARSEGHGVPCPNCGSRSSRSGPWPWYLGTVGAIVCKAVICNNCGHEYDARKPHANLATRKRNLAFAINGCGLVGIATVLVLLVLWARYIVN